MPDSRRAAYLERMALVEVGDLLWAEGRRLRPEILALADRGRLGRSWDVDQAIARAVWGARRLTGPCPDLSSSDAVRSFLGLRRVPEPDLDENDLDRDELWLRGLDESGLQYWCSALARIEDAHPLTRAAAGFHIWRGLMLSNPDRILEPAVIALRLAASTGRESLRSVPLAFENPRGLPLVQGTAVDKLAAWLKALIDAALRVQLVLDRLESWKERADRSTTDMKGKGVRTLLDLLTSRPVISTRDAADALRVSTAQARLLLNRIETRALAREITGQERFRFWTASF